MLTQLRLAVAAILIVFSLSAAPALAVQPDEMLKDPGLEARARTLSKDLRCLVCQNQSIDDSDAGLAHDLRVLLRERLTAGDTDAQAMAFITARYGDFVLLRPPMQWNTALLWLGPAALLLAAGAAFYRFVRGHEATPATAPLSTEEQAQLLKLMEDGPQR